MSEYDGEIQLSVSLKPGDIKTSAQRLSQSVKDIFDKSAGQTLDKSLQRVMSSMDKVNSKAQSLQKQMKVLENTKVPTAEYQSIGKDIDTISNKMDAVNQKMKVFEANGNTASKEYAKLRDEMAKLEKVEDGLLQKSFALEDSGKAYTAGVDTDKYIKLSDDLSKLNNQQRINIATYNETERKLNDVANSTEKASKETKKFDSSLKSTSKSASGFDINLGKIFKKILMYGFGIRSVYILIRKLRQAISEGLKSMAQMNNGANETNRAISQLSTSFYAFKNSIAAAVAPLVNLLAPALSRIIDLLTSAMNAVASFIAALTGKSSFMKAVKVQQNYAGALDKTAGSAKKAKKELQQLAGFDELNVLHKQDEDTSGGGGGGGAAPAFEEVKIDPKILDMVNKLKEAWGKIKGYLDKLKDAFMSGFWEAMGDWQSKVADIKKNLDIIWKDLKEIATDPDVLAAADRWAKSFAHMLGTTAGMFASIGLTIAQNLIGGFAKFLEENKGEIKQWLVEMFDIGTVINDQIADFEVALARIFDVFGGYFGQELTANLMGILWEVQSNILLFAAKLGRDIITLITQPIIDNVSGFQAAFNGILQVLSMVAQTVKNTLNSMFADVQNLYDQHIKPLFDELTMAISWVVEMMLRAFNNYIQPMLMSLADKFDELMSQHISPAFTKATHLIGSIVDLIKAVLVPVIILVGGKVKETIALITPIIQNVAKFVMEIIGNMIDWLGNLMEVVANVVDFIVALMNGDWKAAWEAGGRVVESVVTLIKGIYMNMVNTLIAAGEGLVNTLIGMINHIADALLDVLGGLDFTVPDWVPVFGGKHFEIPVRVPHISEVSFPRLAQGAVIPPNKEFMAVLGDQTSGTNIETPLSTMIEAFNAAKGDEEALLREQNEILRELLYKEWKLDPKDVFNATREQNKDFIRRTGKSAFAY